MSQLTYPSKVSGSELFFLLLVDDHIEDTYKHEVDWTKKPTEVDIASPKLHHFSDYFVDKVSFYLLADCRLTALIFLY